MSARDELTALLAKHKDCAFSASGVLVCTCGTAMQPNEVMDDLSNLAAHQADTLLAAGYRKPRTIATAEELDAIRAGSVVHDGEMTWERGNTEWFTPMSLGGFATSFIDLPATVLYQPEATS